MGVLHHSSFISKVIRGCDSSSDADPVTHFVHELEELVQQRGDEGLDGSHLLFTEGLNEASERYHCVDANLSGAEAVRQGFEQGFR